MSRVIDLECNLPAGEEYPEYHDMLQGRPGNPVADRLERPEGYGFDNYKHIFRNRTAQYVPQPESAPGERMEKFIADMDRAGVECGVVGASNETLKRVCGAYPDRFVGLAAISPLDGMRGVRELERLVREHGIGGLRVVALYNMVPASDRRYYPLYAKCVELDLPVRVYTSMNYANDRPYDLGHPRHLDNVAMDFPELRIVAGLSGWPWIERHGRAAASAPESLLRYRGASPAPFRHARLGVGAVPAIRQHAAAGQDHGRPVARHLRRAVRGADR